MAIDAAKIPFIGNDIKRYANKVAGNPPRPGAGKARFGITDIGRKRLHSMEDMSGQELTVLQLLAKKNYPISGWEILNNLNGQMDQATLQVTMSELIGKQCVQRTVS